MANRYREKLDDAMGLPVDELVSEARRYLSAGVIDRSQEFVRDVISMHDDGVTLKQGHIAGLQRCVAYQWCKYED